MASRKSAAAAAKAQPENQLVNMGVFISDYQFSTYVRGDNTPACAEYLGYLDARKLYPEFQPKTFKDFVAELLEGKGEMVYKHLRAEFAKLNA
jgi:hypothetical protein